jgi:hippurate hydrolase
MPHAAADPIPVAAEIVLALQSMVTRRVDVFDPAVVTVAHISGGSTNNVIPDSVFLEGTLRTLSAVQRGELIPAIGRLAAGIAAAHGLTAEFEHDPGYPVTVNDPGVAAQVLTTAADLLGAQASVLMRAPLMGAEDFSYVLDRVPGVMAFLGACPPGHEPESAPPNHSNLVVFDEEPLPAGVALYARMAMQALAG